MVTVVAYPVPYSFARSLRVGAATSTGRFPSRPANDQCFSGELLAGGGDVPVAPKRGGGTRPGMNTPKHEVAIPYIIFVLFVCFTSAPLIVSLSLTEFA